MKIRRAVCLADRADGRIFCVVVREICIFLRKG